MADLGRHLDKAYEGKDFDDLADSPVDALEGLSKGDAEALQKAFNIKTIRQLAESKFVLRARARMARPGDADCPLVVTRGGRGMSLAGKRALVTGASKGIGAGIALALAREGADVAVNYHRDAAGAEDVARQIGGLGRKSAAIGANVGQVADCQRLVAAAAAALGGLDILVNNAGITLWEDFFATDEAHWDATIDTNLKGAFFCTQAAARIMREGKWGRIVNISSGASKSAFVRATPYNASKGGLNMLTVGTAVELGRYGITVNAVAPGAILIERTSHELPDYAGTFAAATPLGRVGYPEDIAGGVLYFCSDAASYVTGQVFWVDGGLSLRSGHFGDRNANPAQ